MFTLRRCALAALALHPLHACADSVAAKDTAPHPRPNILLVMVDDAPALFYRDWDSKNPFRGDGVRPENRSRDPEGSDIYIQHPTLDRLARSGVTFLNHYAQPTCGTNRAALFSGLWAHRNGIGSPVAGAREFNNFHHNGRAFDRAVPLAKALAGEGYTTGLAGKWHLAAKREHGGTDWDHVADEGGWDWFAATFSNFTIEKRPVGGPRRLLSPVSREHGWTPLGNGAWSKSEPATFTSYDLRFLFFDGAVSRQPEASAEEVDEPGEWHASPDGALTLMPGSGGRVESSRRLKGGHYNFLTNRGGTVELHQTDHSHPTSPLAAERAGAFSGDLVFADAERFVAEAPEPWFLTITPNSPHSPYEYPMPDDGVLTERYRQGPNTGPNEQSVWTNFCAQLEFHDARLGTFLDGLDPGVRERTVVIWTSDNGAPQQVLVTLRDDPLHGLGASGVGSTLSRLIDDGEGPDGHGRFKGSVYEGSARVPLVIAGPPVAPSMRGVRTEALCHTVDLYATILDLAGTRVPDLSGISQHPVLAGSVTEVRDRLLLHTFRIGGSNGDPTAIVAGPDEDNFEDAGFTMRIRDAGDLSGRYKLVRRLVGASPRRFEFELYRLEGPDGAGVDPYELDDLIGVEGYAAIEGRLRAGLRDVLAD